MALACTITVRSTLLLYLIGYLCVSTNYDEVFEHC